jgi:hypothetical protein
VHLFSAAALLTSIVMAGCATTSDVPLLDIVGRWHGAEYQPTNSKYLLHWVLDRRLDGKFSLTTYEEIDCRLVPFSRESGEWSIGNGLYTMITTEVDGNKVDVSNRFYTDVYRIDEIGADRIVYTSIAMGITFYGTRVQPDFLPTPTAACNAR